MVLLFWKRDGEGEKVVCVCMGGDMFRTGHAEDSEKLLEGDGHYGLLSECYFIGCATYESHKNVAVKKYILASCPVNRVHFNIQRVNFATGYRFLPGFTNRNEHPKLISLSGGAFRKFGNFIDVSDLPFSCTLQIIKRSTLNRNVLFLHHTLLNLSQP